MAENQPYATSPKNWWVLAFAVVLSGLVVLGCFLALIFVDFTKEDTAEFVVLVRNIALIGAAAIALPLSVVAFWLRTRSFRLDLNKEVREETDRRAQERRQIEEKLREAQEQELDKARHGPFHGRVHEIMAILREVGRRNGCTAEELDKHFPSLSLDTIRDHLMSAWTMGLVEGITQEETADGTVTTFGVLLCTSAGTEWVEERS